MDIPRSLTKLPRDERGFPIPAVMHKSADKPFFSTIDHARRAYLLEREKCAICGKKMLQSRWFAGSPITCLSAGSLQTDLPLHRDCAAFALTYCPWFAAPTYAKTKLGWFISEAGDKLAADMRYLPNRPDWFVAIRARSVEILPATGELAAEGFPEGAPRFLRPQRVSDLEVWRDGEQQKSREALDEFWGWLTRTLASLNLRPLTRVRELMIHKLREAGRVATPTTKC